MLFLLTGYSCATQAVNVGVMNFYSDSPSDASSQISYGFSETLINKLQKLDNVNVMNREKLLPILNKLNVDINQKLDNSMSKQIGQRAGLDYLINGTLKEKENLLTAKFQLFNVEKGTVIGEKKFTKDMNKIFDLQAEIAMEAAKYFNSPVTEKVKKELFFIPAQNLSSFQQFSSGLKYYEENRADEAYKFFLKSVQSDTGFLEAHKYFQYAARKSGKLDEFITHYESMLKKDPENSILMNYLGNAFVDKGEVNKAESLYKKAIKNSPAFANPYNNLGTIYAASGNFKDAIENLQKALKYTDVKAPVYYNLGLCYLYMNDNGNAKTYFTHALDIDPSNPDFVAAREMVYGFKVVVSYREKKVPGGVYGEILVNSKSLTDIETSASGMSALERAKVISERLQQMINNGLNPFDIEIAKKNKEIVLQTTRGDLIMTVTKNAALREGLKPEEMAKKKLELLEKMLYYTKNVNYTSTGFITQSIEADNKDHIKKGDVCYAAGNLEEAEKEYKEGLKENPSLAYGHFCLGMISFDKKDYESAFSFFNKALELAPDYTQAYIWSGKTCLNMGDEGKAKTMFLKALELEPDNEEVKGLLSSE
jgi:tetratricopeptide (TPR) repeat protein